MKCTCEIRSLMSVGCRCGGFTREQALSSSGSIAPPVAPSVPTEAPPLVQPSVSRQQEQLLVRGMSGTTYWVVAGEWSNLDRTTRGRIHAGVGPYKGMEGELIFSLNSSKLEALEQRRLVERGEYLKLI